MKRGTVIWIVVIALVAIGFVAYRGAEAPEAPQAPVLSAEDIETITAVVASGDAVLLDVRTDEELVADGYALGSTHFDVVRMRDGELPDIEPETSVYVYCKGGARAEEAREILEAAGFTQVVNIGGLVDWVAAGGPLAD